MKNPPRDWAYCRDKQCERFDRCYRPKAHSRLAASFNCDEENDFRYFIPSNLDSPFSLREESC